jgi:type II secretory pathway pseudopilin PulG
MRPNKKLLITLLLMTLACAIVVVGAMYYVSSRREAQKVQLRAKVIQLNIQIAEAGQQTKALIAQGEKLSFDADINARLDDLSDLTEQTAYEGAIEANRFNPSFPSSGKFVTVYSSLLQWFSPEELEFLRDKRNRYSKRTQDLLRAAHAKAEKLVTAHMDKLTLWKDKFTSLDEENKKLLAEAQALGGIDQPLTVQDKSK